ncbi:MAG: HAD family hydrolase [Terriglobia bacterium]
MPIERGILSSIQLLIFDLDGTLIDSKLDLALGVNAMRVQRGLAPLDSDVIGTYVGHGVANLVRRSLGEGASEAEVEACVEAFIEHYRAHMLDNTVPYPGVIEALEALRGRSLAVLSNKPVVFSREILAGLNMARFFAFVYGGNSFDRKKPDPAGVRKLMADLHSGPQQTLIIGDSDTDVLTGRNAGVWTCGVTYGFGAPTLAKAPPDLMIDDLRRLPALLKSQ